ncbi:MAG: hypothetical protein VX987_12960 [Pseudomonadota bacterium]|nr:hypothetical protein [Pseudomonadota bacterium]
MSYGGNEEFTIVNIGLLENKNTYEVGLYIDPRVDEIYIRMQGDKTIVFDEVTKHKIGKNKEIYSVILSHEGDVFYGGLNGVLNEIPIGDSPLEISYVELNGSKYNEVDYIFGDLQIF